MDVPSTKCGFYTTYYDFKPLFKNCGAKYFHGLKLQNPTKKCGKLRKIAKIAEHCGNCRIPEGGELCPGKILSGRNSAGKNSVPILILPGKILSSPAGMGKISRPKIFEGNFACNWSLCVGQFNNP